MHEAIASLAFEAQVRVWTQESLLQPQRLYIGLNLILEGPCDDPAQAGSSSLLIGNRIRDCRFQLLSLTLILDR